MASVDDLGLDGPDDEPGEGFSGLNLVGWAAQLEVAVTLGFELASIDRYLDPAGEILADQLSGLPCGTATDVRQRWPRLDQVQDRTDPTFVAVVGFVLDRVRALRVAAYDMTLAVVDRPEAA